MNNMIYLDYNATTPVDPRVANAMLPFLEQYFGNPSSSHSYGIEPKMAIMQSRKQIAGLIHARPDEIIFTSGGTESNNFAIKGAAWANRDKGNHILTTSTEHPAVTEVCRHLEHHGFSITWLPVDEYGRVDPAIVAAAITPATILISVMHANNETGTIQPIEAIGKIARERGVLFHTDAAQSVGKIMVDVERLRVDLLSIAGHKLYAPKGVGALYIRRGVKLEKLIHGADHESNLRAGTENVMEIAGLGMAADMARLLLESNDDSRIRAFRNRLYEDIRSVLPEVRLNGHPEERLPNTLSLGFPGVDAALMLGEMTGLAASAGAACHSAQEEVSGVLAAMHTPMEYAMGTIRFSLGRMTTGDEVSKAAEIVVSAYRRLKGAPPGEAEVRMTDYTHSLGCACKIRPQVLEKILQQMPLASNPAVLVSCHTSDDAAVYQVSGEVAIVQTVDFIPPVVDDPYMFGAVAAANALSDIYAMGAEPLFALSIVGFPDKILPPEVLQMILKGAGDKVAEAGIQVLGGHSIEDPEPKCGLVVTGRVHPSKILRNSTARPGDALILTKPLGTGIISTAIKRGIADSASVTRIVELMTELNRVAAETMLTYPVNACTDVTGFGLLGHLKEMMCGAGVRAKLRVASIPVLEAAWEYALAGAIPGGTKNNLEFVGDHVTWGASTPELLKYILADAQTSGGLLISLPEEHAAGLIADLHASGIRDAAMIGFVSAGEPMIIV
jgi:cysteine desulfurase NifS/selenium donor protein